MSNIVRDIKITKYIDDLHNNVGASLIGLMKICKHPVNRPIDIDEAHFMSCFTDSQLQDAVMHELLNPRNRETELISTAIADNIKLRIRENVTRDRITKKLSEKGDRNNVLTYGIAHIAAQFRQIRSRDSAKRFIYTVNAILNESACYDIIAVELNQRQNIGLLDVISAPINIMQVAYNRLQMADTTTTLVVLVFIYFICMAIINGGSGRLAAIIPILLLGHPLKAH